MRCFDKAVAAAAVNNDGDRPLRMAPRTPDALPDELVENTSVGFCCTELTSRWWSLIYGAVPPKTGTTHFSIIFKAGFSFHTTAAYAAAWVVTDQQPNVLTNKHRYVLLLP